MTETEPVPSVGSQVARYSFLREVARGPLGPLFECRKDGSEGASEMLARVVALPFGLTANAEKQFSDAAWDSAVTAHALSVRVADVVFGKGWFTLVHDRIDGILLSVLEEKAVAFNLTFPANVAARIALDILEGLELSREQCDAAQLIWRTGSVSAHSLNLCRDGRTRALDGQVAAAALRLLAGRRDVGGGVSIPPELLEDPTNSSERLDVFMVGSLLWTLLTGRKLEFARDYRDGGADVTNAVPARTNVPKGLAQAISQALRIVPAQRQGSLRELTVALVMGTEKVATYPEVIEFVDALLLLESSRTGSQPDELSTKANLGDSSATMNPEATVASLSVESPLTTLAGVAPPARLAMISWPDELPPLKDNHSRAGASRVELHNDEATMTTEVEPLPLVPVVALCEESPIVSKVLSGEAAKDSEIELFPAGAYVASNEVASNEVASNEASSTVSVALREQQITLPGTGSASIVTASELSTEVSPKTTNADESVATVERQVADANEVFSSGFVGQQVPERSAVALFGKGASKPLVTRAALTSNRPPKADNPVEETRSGKPVPSDAVKEVLLALEKKSPSKAPPTVADDRVTLPVAPKQRQLQLSVPTLILGFSTTVLAVIVIMLFVMRSQSAATGETKSLVVEAQSGMKPAVTPDGPVVEAPPQASDAKDAKVVEQPPSGTQLATPTVANGVKPGLKQRTARPSVGANSKATSFGDNADPDDANSSGQKHPKNYVPNDL